MKTFAAIAIAATLVAKTVAYSEEACPADEILKLSALAGAPDLGVCQDASGYTLLPPAGYPTNDQIFLLCAIGECRSTLAFLAGLNPTDCQLEFAGVTMNVRNVSDSYLPACAALGL